MQKKTRSKVSKGGDPTSIKANVVGSPGSNYLVLDIHPGQVIHTDPGSLIYLRGDIEKGVLEVGGMDKICSLRSTKADRMVAR